MLVVRYAFGLFAVLALSSCNNDGPTMEQFNAEHVPQWRKLGDGGSFARLSIRNGENELAVRCWPGQGGKFHCLRVGKSNAITGGMVNISLGTEDALPTFEVGIPSTGDGYSCMYVAMYVESITRGGQILVKNRDDYGGGRWSRSYVSNYMKRNGVSGQPYYRCLDILDAVNRGSLETVSTSAVTRQMIE